MQPGSARDERCAGGSGCIPFWNGNECKMGALWPPKAVEKADSLVWTGE